MHQHSCDYTPAPQTALAMLGSASGSLCPASPRAATNQREGWTRCLLSPRMTSTTLHQGGLVLQGQQGGEGGGPRAEGPV